MKAVVRAWTDNVNVGDNVAATLLFSLPATISLMEGPYGCYCLTRANLVWVHEQLLCAVRIVSIKVRGRYATAVYGRLGDRLGSKCDAPPGSFTGVRFTIVGGKITVLKQVWFKPPGRATIRAA